jgi:hypothetical protein
MYRRLAGADDAADSFTARIRFGPGMHEQDDHPIYYPNGLPPFFGCEVIGARSCEWVVKHKLRGFKTEAVNPSITAVLFLHPGLG